MSVMKFLDDIIEVFETEALRQRQIIKSNSIDSVLSNTTEEQVTIWLKIRQVQEVVEKP